MYESSKKIPLNTAYTCLAQLFLQTQFIELVNVIFSSIIVISRTDSE